VVIAAGVILHGIGVDLLERPQEIAQIVHIVHQHVMHGAAALVRLEQPAAVGAGLGGSAAQMGHADLTMTRRYTEVSDEQVYKSHSAYSPIAMLNNSARRGKI